MKKEIPVFEGRIIVAHKNRILQTAILRGVIAGSRLQVDSRNAIKLEPEVVVRPTMAGISGRMKFDKSLLVNHGSDNLPRLTQLAEDHASIRSIENIQDSIKMIQEQIQCVSGSIVDPENTNTEGLHDERIEEFFRFLAIHGRILYEAIILDQLDKGWLPRHPQSIQLISARAESYLPLEFLYEKPMPKNDASLCPNAVISLKEGKCQDCLMKDDSAESPYVCPIGFWCLNKIIERHANDETVGKLLSSDYAMQAEPIDHRTPLNVLKSCLFAGSDKVDKEVPGKRREFLETLNTVSGNAGIMVSKWDDWVQEVNSKHPTLMVMMPHTFHNEDLNLPVLEIGTSEHLTSSQIGPKFVRNSPEYQAPVVALLGCNTMVPDSIYMGFVPRFRRNGAAIVICTLAIVIGRHIVSVSIAQSLVEKLKTEIEKDENHSLTFGEVLLDVRRKSLLQGMPNVLSLVAFGDADWRLGSGRQKCSVSSCFQHYTVTAYGSNTVRSNIHIVS